MYKELHNMDAVEYKKYHESYMQNNHGSSAIHTFFCIFFTVQCSLFCCISIKHSGLIQYLFEYISIVLPLIIAHTVGANYIYILNCVIFAMLVFKFVHKYPKLQIYNTFTSLNYYKTGKVSSITCLRGLTYLITVFAILAVDFQCFPRYLAKTEDYGYSLMDTGVGLFVLMSGLVHKELRHQKFNTILRGNIKFISILFCLGIGRFVSVKQLDYQEHVTEYGVHWNFFFTLAVCKLISTMVLYYCPHALTTSVVTLIIHESLLYSGLEHWVFGNTPRTNLLNANREGVASSLGYVSLYLFAAYVKSVICDTGIIRLKIEIRLIVLSVVLSFLAFIINYYRPSSRTLANAGYCLYIEAILAIVLSIMYFLEVLFQNKDLQFKIPCTLSDVNHNGLIYFLASNLLTGGINLSIRTLSIPVFETFLILNIYMIMSLVLVFYLNKKDIRV